MPADPQARGPALIDRLGGSEGEAWRTLFDQAPTGIVIVDAEGRVLLANDAAQALAGRADDPVPRHAAVTELFHTEDREKVAAELARIGAGLGGRSAVELRLAERQGEGGMPLGCSVAMVAFTPVIEEGGTPSGAVIRLTDITRHRVIETQLAQTQKMQAVGQLAGGIAHDFNNLLTAIIAATDLCLGRDDLAEPLQADLLHIRRSAERGAALVKQLLAFSRRQTLQPRIIRLADAIEDVAALLRRLLGQRVALELDLELPSHMIRVDPVQFDQVVVNLALNARDAMPQGGRLTIRTSNLTLYRPMVRGQEVIPPGRYAVVEVADTGIGIAADDLPRLFEPFFTTKKEAGGTGLGLATVYGIVRQTDGFISVESVPGEGTTFRIYLPIVPHEQTAQREPPPEPASSSSAVPAPAPAGKAPDGAVRRGTVLLVEDEDGVRRLSTRALENAGWRVLSAPSGEAALQMLDAEPAPPTVLVSDVVMPGMDGTQVVRAVRARFPTIPVVLVSGYSESAAMDGLPDEDLHFLPKPYTLRQLVAQVNTMAGPQAAG
ncbi:ATP-binding protein [Elioraea tepidiphila]|uniref:ATP-binding protein n=1 Tax=Elioraea tepidiphila TaxID=457934 RepID=UPI00036A7412|nr:ATP-binding protein [Elioraea tepidiphila]